MTGVLPAPYTSDIAHLVQGMLSPVVGVRLTAGQFIIARLISDTRTLMFDLPICRTIVKAIVGTM